MDGRTLDKAVAPFNVTRCSLRLAVVVGARIPRRPFVVTMPARIEQERHQGEADHQREDYADRPGEIADPAAGLRSRSSFAPRMRRLRSTIRAARSRARWFRARSSS